MKKISVKVTKKNFDGKEITTIRKISVIDAIKLLEQKEIIKVECTMRKIMPSALFKEVPLKTSVVASWGAGKCALIQKTSGSLNRGNAIMAKLISGVGPKDERPGSTIMLSGEQRVAIIKKAG